MKKHSNKKKKFKWIFIIEIICIIALIPVLYLFYQLDRIPTSELNTDNISVNDINLDDLKGYRNIAIFGVDSRSNDLKKNTRSDSIMIASINKKTKDVKLVSLYRDTYVNVPGHGFTKLTHAYAYGGPELALSTINTNFDLDIKEFVTVNFSAVTNVIDLLGGVTLDITDAELKYVNGYTKDINRINNSNSPFLKTSGTQLVNGTQATAYSRIRYTKGGDFKRAERQRIVLGKILDKAKTSKITTIISVSNEMIPQIYTSLSTPDILSLAKDIFAYSLGETNGFPFEKEGKIVNKVSYVLPLNLVENVSTLHHFLFDNEEYVPSEKVKGYSREIQAVLN